jgi:long-subunit fatty acid transport protein
MAVVKASYEKGNLTANLGLNTGDFPAANMAHERELLRMLYEANVSYKFFKKFQFTAGMFGSHMGFESALSFNNLLTSHSLASEWTPYYLAGAKLEYMPNDKWLLGLTVANGNQAITEYEGNTNKLLGLQLNWSPNKNLTINYSNMYYNDAPDSAAQNVFYNNLYATYSVDKKLDIVAGFDYGINNNTVTNTTDGIMVGSLLARYHLTKAIAVAGRAEYYNDEKGSFIKTPTGFAFETMCYSMNLDYSPAERIKFRLEGRMFSSNEPFYRDDSNFDPNTSQTIRYTTQNANVLLSVQAKF